MFDLLVLVITVWLAVKVLGLLFRTAWGLAKILASLLLALAVPALILCLVFAGGILLLIPALMIAAALGILRGIL